MSPVVFAHGAAIPAIGFGSSPMLGEECTQAVLRALEVGYRHIDASANSGGEPAVGEALRRSGLPRDEIFITTKVWWKNLREQALLSSARASADALGVDQVDLLLVHWPNAEIPLAETMDALATARRIGLARHIGVANFPSALFRQAVALCAEPLAANQCEYHPGLDQHAVLDAVRASGAAFISYSPLGRGSPMADPVIEEIARRHGRTKSQIALRWNIQQPGVCAVPRSSNSQRIAENLDVFDFTLASDEMQRISALASPGGRLVNPGFAPQWD